MDRMEYLTEVERIAEWIYSGDFMEETGLDDKHAAIQARLKEHEYIIYYDKAYLVMGFTEHPDAIYKVEEPDVRKLHYASINCLFARYAMEADIDDAISRQFIGAENSKKPYWLFQMLDAEEVGQCELCGEKKPCKKCGGE